MDCSKWISDNIYITWIKSITIIFLILITFWPLTSITYFHLIILFVFYRYLNERMILHEPFVQVEPLYTSVLGVDAQSRSMLVTSLQTPSFSKLAQHQRQNSPLSTLQPRRLVNIIWLIVYGLNKTVSPF